LQPTLLGYLVNRVGHYLDHGNTGPSGYLKVLEKIAKTKNYRHYIYRYSNQSSAKHDYLEARLHHLFGEYAAARKSYENVVEREGNNPSVFGRAASIFITRIDSNLR
jgi:hypothetical protein